MGTSARLTIAITCVVVAVVLHLSLCQWLTSWSQKGQPILTIETNNERMGLYTRDIPRQDAWVFGVAAPILLLGIAISQVLEVFTRSRTMRGGCTRCGYDLSQHTGNVCPECGMSRNVSLKS